MKKIVLTGATGSLGKKIVRKLIELGDEVCILTRSAKNAKKIFPTVNNIIEWSPGSNAWYSSLEGADAVINLAGENIMARRWNEEHKRKILLSRVNSVQSLISAIEHVKNKPKVFISASAVGYYGNREEEVDENSKPEKDFMADVTTRWENETKKIDRLAVRRVNIRIGIVLDKENGALARMILPFKFFVGGPLGSGAQWFPWVHVDDVVGIFLFALDNENVDGILNAVSPNPARMNEFCKTLGMVMKRPSMFRVPEFVLKIILGEAAQVILGGAKVIPKRTEGFGYKFEYSELTEALKNLLHDNQK
ncbi:MAG: TIGR01777 family oxidoreductase [Bacteroidetes bacterium]|nr:TIGR01777 family oxidoreductase [Bacteroidota bacterium]